MRITKNNIYKYSKLESILEDTNSIDRMVNLLKTGTLVGNTAEAESAIESDVKIFNKNSQVMLRLKQDAIKEYDLLLEFATLSSLGLVKIYGEEIFIQISYVDWIFEYLNEIREQTSFGELFKKI